MSVFIFDCDGVLLDSNRVKEDAFVAITSKYFDEEAAEFIRNYHRCHGGLSRQLKFSAVIEKFKIAHEVNLDELCSEFEAVASIGLKKCRIAENVFDILEALRSSGHALVVLSGTPQESLESLLKGRNLYSFFDQILGSPSTKIHHLQKLHDENILNAAKPFYFVGDSSVDFNAAQEFKNCRFFWSEEFAPAPHDMIDTDKLSKLKSLLSVVFK